MLVIGGQGSSAPRAWDGERDVLEFSQLRRLRLRSTETVQPQVADVSLEVDYPYGSYRLVKRGSNRYYLGGSTPVRIRNDKQDASPARGR
jgi:hypothetical protein